MTETYDFLKLILNTLKTEISVIDKKGDIKFTNLSWKNFAEDNDCKIDFNKDKEINYFKVDASQPLLIWRNKGWINEEQDPRGWFQWYCRYFYGRRIEEYDKIQIKRWKAFSRHIGQIKKNCIKTDFSCRPKQRQALLHWAYDSRKI